MTKIEWTERTLFGDPLPRRCRKCRTVKPSNKFKKDRSRRDKIAYVCSDCDYIRKTPGPRRTERREQAAEGLSWCAGCQAWIPSYEIPRSGRCRACLRRYERSRYAADPCYRAERRQHAHSRKRGVEPVPIEGQENLLDTFKGLCAYCPSPAATWDHVVPITKGGLTTPDNILPACASCNSSKGNRDLYRWLDATGRAPHVVTFERLAHYQVLP